MVKRMHSLRQMGLLWVPIALLWLVAIALFTSCGARREVYPDPEKPLKREVRAAWLPTVYRTEYSQGGTEETKRLLEQRIEALYKQGCNVVIFQVRPESDAFYRSKYEPWSRYLTGTQGRPPYPEWDPLDYLCELCHRYGMELHAWINPYRAATNINASLAPTHPYAKHPEWFVIYNNQLLYDPGVPACRRYICDVVSDLVLNHDIDAVHMDDYFYPYPAAGQPFPDDNSFALYGAGYSQSQRADWRRNNVNQLVRELKSTLLSTKPWVRLGISPFGIYRNQRTWSKGSATSGLQNYDDLYADVLLWMERGWVDYVVPQIYWNKGTKAADYDVLVEWWGKLDSKQTQLYVGQDVKRTMDSRQLHHKLALSRKYADGHVWWPAEELLKNYRGVADSLKKSYQHFLALPPAWKKMIVQQPQPISALHAEWVPDDGYILMWEDLRDAKDPTKPFFYAVYAFPKGVKADVNDSRFLVQVSNRPYYKMPYVRGKQSYTYLVTTIDRFWNESKPCKLKVSL